MAVSEAQKKATARYEKKAYVQVRTRFKPDDAKNLYAHAEQRKESVNGFINRAVIEQIERDSNTESNQYNADYTGSNKEENKKSE